MLIVTKPLHSQRNKFILGVALLFAFLTVAPSSTFATNKNIVGVVAPSVSASAGCNDVSSAALRTNCEVGSDKSESTTESDVITSDDGGDMLARWIQLTALLILIALVGYFIYEKIAKGTSRAPQITKTTIRTSESKSTTTVFPSSKPILEERKTRFEEKGKVSEPPKTSELVKPTEPVATPELAKKPQPAPTAAKVERPILATTNTSSTSEAQPQSQTETKTDHGANERVIVQPPQIGEPSSFARHDWWDKDREWCQVSPLGMSSDVVCDIGTFGTVAIAAASLRGHKHKVSGEPCQDAFSLRTTQSLSGQKYVVAVLCDGMSSAKHSEYGARRTSQLLAWSLAAMIEDQDVITEQQVKSVLPEIFKYCKQNLMPQEHNQFGAAGISPKEVVESDFFTTVTFMIVPASSVEGETLEAIVGSIGDSAVFVLNNSTTLWEEIATVDASSEILNPATSAFPATLDAKVSTISVSKADLVIATSDGVGNFINVRGNQTSLGTYLAKQWGKPVNLPTFINDVGFDLKSADDDRTVIAIWLSRS